VTKAETEWRGERGPEQTEGRRERGEGRKKKKKKKKKMMMMMKSAC
jgi:hypothetical protein